MTVQAGGADIHVASYSVPSLADWNSDGLTDLIVGEKTATLEGKIRVYLNSGTNAAPAYGPFSYAQTAVGDLSVPGAGCLGVFPRVFDWNQDGMKDLVMGLADGTVQVALNEHNDTEPIFASPFPVQVGQPGAKGNVDVGVRTTLAIVDWNNDERYDLAMGDFEGNVRVLLNEADSGPADFRTEVIVLDATVGQGVPTGRASISVVDLDGDGRKDLVVGNTEGQVLHYADVGVDAAPQFAGYEAIKANGIEIDLPDHPRSRPFMGDFNNDGTADLLVGAKDGLVRLYVGSPSRTILVDFGDAPSPYPITLAENGARHLAAGPMLGMTRDVEADGVHSANADADDTTGTPVDEDGVTLGNPIKVAQLDANVTVTVHGAPTGAKLDAWVDFNGDGSWGGPFDQIADSAAVINGSNTITFDVPGWAEAGTTFARFRISTAGGLGVEGPSPDGEVEDYLVTIQPPGAAGTVFSQEQIISTSADGAESVFAVDMDGDGDMDVLSASVVDNTIAWYENNGSQAFTTHGITNAASGARVVFPADVDGDGDLDVLSASWFDNTIAWYENDGLQNFTKRTISTSADWPQSIFAADLDSDGDMDVLSASQQDGRVAWYENDGTQAFTTHTISAAAADQAIFVSAADVDRDGDMDVLSAWYEGDILAWHENDGNENFVMHTISAAVDNPRWMFVADIDGDVDIDVLSASVQDDQIVWHENDGNQDFTDHIISTEADFALSVCAADLDGDGDTDVLSASTNDDKIAWYENDGSQNWVPYTITTSADQAASVFVADMDADGDLDVLSASKADNKIAWYESFGSVISGAKWDDSDGDGEWDTGELGLPGWEICLHESANGHLHGCTTTDGDGEYVFAGLPSGTYKVIEEQQNGWQQTYPAMATVHFADPNLKAAVEEELGVTDPTRSDMLALVSLDARNRGIIDLTGVEYARNLKFLDLRENQIVDVSPISGLVDLTDLYLNSNKIGDISPLSGLTNLAALFLRYNQISDITPLSPLINLRTLYLYDNQVSDVSGLSALRNLTELELGKNEISGIAPLSGLVDLTYLLLWENQISEIGPLSGLVSIEELFLGGNQISDISPLSGLADLSRLHLSNNQINEISSLATLTSLRELDLLGNQIGNLAPLSELTNLTALVLSNNQISELDPLAGLINLDGLHLGSNQITDIGPISGLSNLVSLLVDRNQITDISPVSGLVNITYLSTGYNQISDISPISGLADLEQLNLEANRISDISPISEHVHLTLLHLQGNPLNDEAYSVHIPQIEANNPGIAILYDPPPESSAENSSEPKGAGEWHAGVWDVPSGLYAAPSELHEADGKPRSEFASANAEDDNCWHLVTVSFNDVVTGIDFGNYAEADFGDAPILYPTRLVEDGARHVAAGPTMGGVRDYEADGMHSPNADADDSTGAADEDGVTFVTPIIVGQLDAGATVNVQNAPDGAKLDAWIDFDGDGSWSGSTERIANGMSVIEGDNTVIFDVPNWAHGGPTFARFRLSTVGGLGVGGLASDGEVEDYQVTIEPQFDFGDAPGPYPVTLAEDGARHVASGPTLGANRDVEPDGVHSANADADDLAGEIATGGSNEKQMPVTGAELEPEAENGSQPDLVAFAQALTLNGVKLHGARWCHNCVEQKRLFEDGAQFLPFIDLFNADGTRNDVEPGITSIPAWDFPDGNGGTNRVFGRLTLEQISAESGIAIPTSDNPWMKPVEEAIRLLAGSPLHQPLDGYDPNGDPLTYAVTVEDANGDPSPLVTAEVLDGNRSMRVNVVSQAGGFTMDMGEMVFELFEKRVPRPTDRLVQLTESGFYDDSYFYRLEPGFVIQGGGMSPTQAGNSGLGTFDDQFHVDIQHNRDGVLSYAKGADDTNDASYFVTLGPARHLDFDFSAAGQLVEGFETLRDIEQEPVVEVDPDDNPATNNSFHSPEFPKQVGVLPAFAATEEPTEIFTDRENAVVMLKAETAAVGQEFTVTVNAEDPAGNLTTISFPVTVVADIPENGGANGGPFLEDIGRVVTPRNTPAQIQLSAIDVEGDPVFYDAAPAGDVNYQLDVDHDTGLVTVTPPDDFAGELEVLVGVRALNGSDTADPWDQQLVTIDVLGAPTLDLLPSSDSNIPDDNVTNVTDLTFRVSNVVAGAHVEILDGETVIGQGTANSSIDIAVANVAHDIHQLTARQTLDGIQSDRSAVLQIMVDTLPPAFISIPPTEATVGVTLVYDVATPGEGAAGEHYSLVGAPDGASIHAGTGVLSWTPTQDQTGTHTFQIQATDLAGNATVQDVSIEVVVVSPIVHIRMETTDVQGNAITNIQPDGEFLLRVFLQDVRGEGIAEGVFASYVNIQYDATLVSPSANGSDDIIFADEYTWLPSGNFATPGLIADVGSAAEPDPQLPTLFPLFGGKNMLQFSIPMIATDEGQAEFAGTPSNDEQLPIAVYGISEAVPPEQVIILGTSLIIGDGLLARDDIFNLDEDSSNNVLDVINNPNGSDENPNGGAVTIISVGACSNGGDVSIPNGEVLSYTPVPDFFGEDKFTYTISNGQSTSTATVIVQVFPQNDDPTAVDDSATVGQDTQDTPIFVLGNDTIAPDQGESLRITGVVNPSQGGTVTIAPGGTHLNYTPTPGFVGQETINYTISDGNGGAAAATVTVTVEEGTEPIAVDDEATVVEDSAANAINVLANDSPAEGGQLSVANVTQPLTGGTVTIGGGGANVLYTPAPDFFGRDTFTYTITETDGGQAIATVTVTVEEEPSPVDDEDGVTFAPIMVGQLDAVVTVNVQNAPDGAILDAWIDFDGDGSWDEQTEQIADSRDVVEGDNAIIFDVPNWAKEGTTFARFRLSTAGNLGVGGWAPDGEVEDHQVTIVNRCMRGVAAYAAGSIGAVGEADEYELEMSGGPSPGVYSFVVVADPGALDPDAVQVLDAAGVPVEVTAAIRDVNDDTESVVVASLSPGLYRLLVAGQRGTVGGYQLEMRMPGDLDCHLDDEFVDNAVVNREVQLAQAAMLQRNFAFDLVAQDLFGQKLGIDLSVDQFRPEFDANLNGYIDAMDMDAIITNNGNGAAIPVRATLSPVGCDCAAEGMGEPGDVASVRLSDMGLAVFQNPLQPTDVNADKHVTPLDALLVIEAINAHGPGTIDVAIGGFEQQTGEGESEVVISSPFYDVNGDYTISPVDVLLVISDLVANSSRLFDASSPEGEDVASLTPNRANVVWPGSLAVEQSQIRQTIATLHLGQQAAVVNSSSKSDSGHVTDQPRSVAHEETQPASFSDAESLAERIGLESELFDKLVEDVAQAWGP